MKDGFLKIGAATPKVIPANCELNTRSIISSVTEAYMRGVRVLVLPELCVTGVTCGDLFLHSELLNSAQKALEHIIAACASFDMVCVVGAPVRTDGKVRNCAVVFSKGEILGMIPKRFIPTDERRRFNGDSKPVVFTCRDYPDLCFGVEFASDLGSASQPSEILALSGANIILCLSGENETVGRAELRRTFVTTQSSRLMCAYVLAGAGDGESTADSVYSGHCIISECGRTLAESELFDNRLITADIDLGAIAYDRRRSAAFEPIHSAEVREFSLMPFDNVLSRRFPRLPFVPDDPDKLAERCDLILKMQASALVKRIRHVGAKKAVLGISGGLDSALALIVCAKAMDIMECPRSDISAITMPCFGTSERTRGNAHKLCEGIGASLREIDISAAVTQHFKDIAHVPELHNAAYENAQARERTQVLMDIANDENGIVIGTGDLSELALGWATFAGDHISMYGVNSELPKTLIRRIVAYYADNCGSEALSAVLRDIIDTPVSPELLPSVNGEIAQKTEDTVGPYELHDFFLFFMLRHGYSPKKLFRAACSAFEDEYEPAVILKWLKTFLRRFFSQQFKRSCQPDGVKLGSVGLSPHGEFEMPSDAVGRMWLDEADCISTEENTDNEHV